MRPKVFMVFCTAMTLVSQICAADEFVGPFKSWADVKTDYGAVGDGIVDDTSALQKAMDELRSEKRRSCVLYLPAGTYRITKTLELKREAHEQSKDVTIIGEDPGKCVILWDGPEGGVMFFYNAWYSKVGRVTFDGRGKALTAVRHGPAFTTYNEFSDAVFKDVEFGIEAGMRDGIAETVVSRCRFSRCSKAGISIQNFNSLDWFVWDCVFEQCNLGVTNEFGAGNFHVYRSYFEQSGRADVSIGNTCYFSMRDNVSVGSKAFFVAGAMTACGNVTIEGNTIVDYRDIAVDMQNLGPFLLFDNVIKGHKSPAVRINPKAGFVSAGNTFSVAEPVAGKADAIRIDDKVESYESLRVSLREPAKPSPKAAGYLVEVSAREDGDAVQRAIDAALAQKGRRPVVHLPAGTYKIEQTISLGAGCDVQIIGDGPDTLLTWGGGGRGPVITVMGPSHATLRDFSVSGGGTADGINVQKCDQSGALIYMDQANVTGAKEAGLVVDGLENADVSLLNVNHGSSTVGVRVIGGPTAAAGRDMPGRVVIFSGASSNNEISYEVLSGGRLLARDIWYESGQFPRFVRAADSGAFTLHGAMVATAMKDGVAAVEVDDFRGELTFLTSIFHSGGKVAPVVVRGDGTRTKLLLLGVQFGIGDGYLVNNSPKAGVLLLESYQYTQGGGGRSVEDVGTADIAFVRRLLSQTRDQKPPVLSSRGADVTDLRLYRVIVSNAMTCVHLAR